MRQPAGVPSCGAPQAHRTMGAGPAAALPESPSWRRGAYERRTANTNATGKADAPAPHPPTSGGAPSEPLALRLEDLDARQAAGERQEPRVGDHPVGRPHAAASDGPAALQQLHRLD